MLAVDITLSSSPRRRKPVTPRAGRARPRSIALAALTGMPDADSFAAWRGRSGRRYVVTRHALTGSLRVTWNHALLIAVRHEADGMAVIVGVRAVDMPEVEATACQAWLAVMQLAGATALDVHLGLSDPSARAEARDDLAP